MEGVCSYFIFQKIPIQIPNLREIIPKLLVHPFSEPNFIWLSSNFGSYDNVKNLFIKINFPFIYLRKKASNKLGSYILIFQ